MDKSVDVRVKILGYYPISSIQRNYVNFAEDDTEFGIGVIVINSLFNNKRSIGVWTEIWEEEKKGPVWRANGLKERMVEENKGKECI